MNHHELSLNGFINEIKDVSSGPHARKFCFVLGAGASKTSGIKTGQELVNIWDKELSERNYNDYLEWKAKLGITEINKYSFYSQYYEKRFKRNPTDGYNFLEKLMEHAKPSSGYVMLSYLVTETNHRVIITTNFDHLAEDAINYYNQKIPLVIGHESLSHYITNQVERPIIVKIHRDLLFDPANRCDQVQELHTNWKTALDIIFSEYHPIFIGYAGNDDSLMDYLLNNSEKFRNGELKYPYWMLYKSDNLEGKVLKFITRSNGYYIKHDGFDEVLYLIGAELDYRMPSKQEFLNDAEKRYQILSDAIDSFTDRSLNSKEASQDTYNSRIVSDEESSINDAVRQITIRSDIQRMYRDVISSYRTNCFNDALSNMQKIIDLSPDNARYSNTLGVILHRMKRYDEALSATLKAVELEPDNAEYHNSLGVTLHEMKRYDEAISSKQKAVELEPDNARYHNSLGATFHEMKRYDEALSATLKAVELEPNNAEYHNSLGVTLHEMKRYNEAISSKQKAVELEPDNAEYHNSLGVTLHEMKRYDEAISSKQKAVELEPDNV